VKAGVMIIVLVMILTGQIGLQTLYHVNESASSSAEFFWTLRRVQSLWTEHQEIFFFPIREIFIIFLFSNC